MVVLGGLASAIGAWALDAMIWLGLIGLAGAVVILAWTCVCILADGREP